MLTTENEWEAIEKELLSGVRKALAKIIAASMGIVLAAGAGMYWIMTHAFAV